MSAKASSIDRTWEKVLMSAVEPVPSEIQEAASSVTACYTQALDAMKQIRGEIDRGSKEKFASRIMKETDRRADEALATTFAEQIKQLQDATKSLPSEYQLGNKGDPHSSVVLSVGAMCEMGKLLHIPRLEDAIHKARGVRDDCGLE